MSLENVNTREDFSDVKIYFLTSIHREEILSETPNKTKENTCFYSAFACFHQERITRKRNKMKAQETGETNIFLYLDVLSVT